VSDTNRTVNVLSPPARNGHRPPASPGASADVVLAIVAADATEREVRMLVEGLRTRDIEASAYDTGPGVVMFEGLPADEVAALLADEPAVERLIMADTRYRLVRRDVQPEGSQVWIGGVPFGRDYVSIMAGPCAVESREQLLTIARACRAHGAAVLRGGAFKPRTSPYDFQGLGMHGLELLAEAREETGMPVITEVMEPAMVERMYPYVDAFQVGARNMQNFPLLKALGDIDKPVMLKRGLSATLEEWLLAAEYILTGGNHRVLLCERGIRTFGSSTRFTLDLAAMALAKRETHLPVIVDPSHATGNPHLVTPMARAALAAGADGLMIEVHNAPGQARSDGDQAIRPAALGETVAQLDALAASMGRTLVRGPLLMGATAG
jgi:3-deoxy-7-phosphoheptulonate synthase